MGEGNSESLATAGGCSTASAQIEARNHPLNFLKHKPLGCRRPCLVQPSPAQPHRLRQPDGSCPGSRSPRGRPVGHGWTTGKPQAPTHRARHIWHSTPAIPGNKDWATISALPQVVGPSTSPSMLREAGTRRRDRLALQALNSWE